MEVTRKQSPSNFPKNEHFLPPTCACQEIRNVRFFGKFGVLCFLVTSILRFVLPKNHFHCVKKQQKKLSLNTGIYGLVKTLDSGILQAVFTRTTHIMLRVILARWAFLKSGQSFLKSALEKYLPTFEYFFKKPR